MVLRFKIPLNRSNQKKSSVHQRSDVLLSKEIASALVQEILSGGTLFPSAGKVELIVPSVDDHKVLVLPSNTINSWIKRGNIIPETGEVLRDVLNDARKEYRTRKIEQKRSKMIEKLEDEFLRTLRIQTSSPIRDRQGNIIIDENGQPVNQENPKLLGIKMKNAMFLAERLMPEVYGKNTKI